MRKTSTRTAPGRTPIGLKQTTICRLSAIALVAMSLSPLAAHADSFADLFMNHVIKDTTVSGSFGINHERRLHNGNADTNGLRTDYGLNFNLHTGALYGFSGDFSYFGSHPLISYSADKYMGFGKNLDKIADLFLQYQGSGGQLRVGRQTINTPFAATDQFTLMPRAFRGQSIDISLFNTAFFTDKPSTKDDDYVPSMDSIYDKTFDYAAPVGAPDVQLYVGHFTEFSSRFSDPFIRGTDEYDTAGPGSLGYDGFLSVGLQYKQSLAAGNVMARSWFYNFKGAAKLAFYEGGYQAPPIGSSGIRPYVRTQFIHEAGSGDYLNQLGSGTVSRVDAKYYGIRVGLQSAWHDLDTSVIYAYQPSRLGAFHNGGLYHPYTDLSGITYDNTMNAGIENTGPGRSYGIRVTANITRYLTGLAGVMYYDSRYGAGGNYYQYSGYQGFAQNGAAPGNTNFVYDEHGHEVDVTLSYKLEGISSTLKNFTIKDAIGLTYWNDADQFVASRHRNFADNRVYLTYSF